MEAVVGLSRKRCRCGPGRTLLKVFATGHAVILKASVSESAINSTERRRSEVDQMSVADKGPDAPAAGSDLRKRVLGSCVGAHDTRPLERTNLTDGPSQSWRTATAIRVVSSARRCVGVVADGSSGEAGGGPASAASGLCVSDDHNRLLSTGCNAALFQGDSLSCLTTDYRLSGRIPPDRSWVFGALPNFLLRKTHGYHDYIFLQSALLFAMLAR